MKRIIFCFVSALCFAAALASLLIMPDIGSVIGMPLAIIVGAIFFAAQLTCCFTVKKPAAKFIPAFIAVIPTAVMILLFIGLIGSGSAIADLPIIRIIYALVSVASIGSTAAWFTYSLIRADRWVDNI